MSIKIFLLIFFLFLIFTPSINQASYCGQSAIPFSLEIKENSQPILGCARPSCFGLSSNKQKLDSDSAQFFKIWGQPDGFIKSVSSINEAKKTSFNEISKCDKSFTRNHCSKGTWVGEIAPSAIITPNYPIKLICCSNNKLNNSVLSGNAQIRAGQMILGGEVFNRNGQQIGFEYISNIWRIFDKKGVLYIAEIRKFDCFSQINNQKLLSNNKIKTKEDIKEKIKELKRINDEKEREILKEFSEYEIDLKDISNNNHSTTQTQQSQHIHIGHRKISPLTKLKSKLDKVEATRRRKQQKWNDNQNVKLKFLK
uniref:Uncharacterized protein n=1 Tax=Meloidogyne enterolobii TaxID=390850 RepID=A0A6V7TMP0_MELEN|nr:unnamed protein product [Meloidogyne enterolobii]